MPIRTIIVRIATPISSGAVKAIDLGIIEAVSAFETGFVELLPFVEGRVYDELFVTPDGYEEINGDWWYHIATPNTLLNNNGLAEVSSSSDLKDTIGSFFNDGSQQISGTSGSSNRIRDCGPLMLVAHRTQNWFGLFRTWSANTPYALGEVVIKNGFMQEITTNGVSGGSEPTWNDTPSGTTADGTIEWTNSGAIPTAGKAHFHAKVIDVSGLVIPRPSTVEFIQQPTDTAQDDTITPAVTVRVLDQNGDPFTLFPASTLQVFLVILGAGTLTGGDNTQIDATTAIATFDGLSIAEAGSDYVLRAYVANTTLPPVDSDPFDITPLIPVTPIAHWEADSLSYNDGDDVTAWADEIAAKTLVPNSATKPTFKTNIVNSLPVVRFDGTNLAYLKYEGFNNGDPSTFIIVAKQSSTATRATMVGLEQRVELLLGSGRFTLNAGTEFILSNDDDSGAFHVFTAVFNSGIGTGYLDGILIASGAAGSDLTTDLLVGGRPENGLTMSGDIAEVWIYDEVLSDLQREFRESALATKYGL